MYEVKYLVEDKGSMDFGKWISVPLNMCSPHRMCDECKKDIKNMDNCDYMFYNTISLQVAKDKKTYLEEDGFKAKIEEVKSQIPPTTKVMGILWQFL